MGFPADRPFWKISASWTIMLSVGLLMLSWSWRKWPDILVDFGWHIYVPWQISTGRILYLDLHSILPPLSPYLNAFIFKIFGVGFMTLAGFNLALTAALTFLTYRIFRKTADLLTAAAAGTTFLAMFAFSEYTVLGNYNYVTPYNQEAAHGILLSFLGLFSFVSYLQKREDRWLGLIGLSLGLAFLTKIEIFISIFLALGAGLAGVAAIDRPPLARVFKGFFLLLLPFFLPLAGFMAYFSRHMSPAQALGFMTMQYQISVNTPVSSSPFYLHGMGLDTPLSNAGLLLLAALWEMVAFLLLLAISLGTGKISSRRGRIAVRAATLVILAGLTPLLMRHIPWMEMFRPLPLLMLGFIGVLLVSLWRRRRDPQGAGRLLPFLVLAVFALALLSKMMLNARIYHYGFALALPATLVALMIFLYHIPRWVEGKFGAGGFFRLLGIAAVAVVWAAHMDLSKNLYDLKTYAVRSNGDTILTWKPEIVSLGPVVQSALAKIQEVVKPGESFVVLPEGIMLNYLAQRRNPSFYSAFLPVDLILYGEERMLSFFNRTPPDYVVLVQRNTSEYGPCCFGRDYGLLIFSWIRENYRPLFLIGQDPMGGDGFGLIIARRRGS